MVVLDKISPVKAAFYLECLRELQEERLRMVYFEQIAQQFNSALPELLADFSVPWHERGMSQSISDLVVMMQQQIRSNN